MRNFLSVVILTSILFAQMHGVSHSFSDGASNNHDCIYCKVQKHQDSVASSYGGLLFITPVGPLRLDSTPTNSKSSTHFLSESSPRGPPLLADI